MPAESPLARSTLARHLSTDEPLDQLEARRLADLFDGIRVYAPLLLGLLLFGAYVVAPHVPGWAVGAFLALLLAEFIVKLSLTAHYQRTWPSRAPGGVWRRILPAGALYSGIVYGAVSLALFVPMPQTTQLLLAVIYTGLLSLAVWGTPQYFLVSACFAIPLTVPVATVLIVTPGASSTLLGIVLVAVTLSGLSVSRHIGTGLIKLIELDIENQRLLARLAAEKAVSESERERAEQAVIDKSLFIATASHDLRQPVHALGLFQHALAVRCEEPRDAALIEAIGESSAALMALLNGLLEVSSLDAQAIDPDWRAVRLDTLVDELARELAPSISARGLTLQVDIERCTVLSDRMLLGRVLRNLLSNAIKFSNEGTITIEAQRLADSDRAGMIRMRVRDQGPGIASDDIDRVFTGFYRGRSAEASRADGSGLGLSIVTRLCALLDISLGLQSQAGQGTTVRLDMPGAPDIGAQLPDLADPAERPYRFDGLRVLIVDDDAAIRHGMRVTLEERGCIVTLAADRAQALARLDVQSPDVVLCDYRIGPDQNGFEIIAALRARLGAPLPAAIISGESAMDTLAHDTDAGIELLRKPVAPTRLYQVLQRLGEERHQASALTPDGLRTRSTTPRLPAADINQ